MAYWEADTSFRSMEGLVFSAMGAGNVTRPYLRHYEVQMRYLIAAPALLLATSVSADPFEECPTEAYLTQGAVSSTYSVNLLSGDYKVAAATVGDNVRINALGFNPKDQYMYGWLRDENMPVRVHSDYSIEPLKVKNISNLHFFVGDVSTNDSKYYVYRRGNKYGMYSISLDPDSKNYLQMERLAGTNSWNLFIYDIAFHPSNGLAYALDRDGDLYQLDVTTGTKLKLGATGESGTFGASYFDAEGNFYASRNNDGNIYRIAVDSGNYSAEFFAKGPASNINDGSRCALAPVTGPVEHNLDFGDAPDSYMTSLEENGARHGVAVSKGTRSTNQALFLGSVVDGESDASAYPLADENDDGVQFVTGIVGSKNAIVVVNASQAGYLNAWVDTDINGQFDANDQVIKDVKVNAGKQYVYFDVPDDTKEGTTWARFRFSSSTGLESFGGSADGEVEDYQVDVQEAEATVTYYPSASGLSTLAFEDNWPHEGDYDMNDLVVHMKTAVWNKPSGVSLVQMKGAMSAVGAAYHNGFAVRLPGVKRNDIDIDNVKYAINDQEVKFQPVESGREEAIFIITYNLFNFVGTGEDCKFYRTEIGCGSDLQMKFEAHIPMKEPVPVALKGVFDPFLFATPGAWHGGHFASAPGRSYEIHLKNYAPTEAFDHNLFNEPGDDASVPGQYYYQTEKGLPWALEIGTEWNHPIEYTDIGHAYPYFSNWATSDGGFEKSWFLPENAEKPLIFVD